MSVGIKTNIRDIFSSEFEQDNKSIKISKIKVPMIQRDYVQGLKENESKLDRFLNALFKAIKDTEKLSLDFIYGNITEDGTFEPIDGQQRLTTLALLNFYLLCRKGCGEENTFTFKRFTYATRQSAKNFCELLGGGDFIKYFKRRITTDSDSCPSEIIKDYPKYFEEYDEDITILSMLGTLDKIHEKFKNEKISDENIKDITFHILTMNNFNLSDDLYIKMNGRGKQLSPFDNFKADYFKWLKGKYAEAEIDDLKRKFNTDYLDIFWDFAINEEGSEIPCPEKLFFRFINRFVVGKYLLLWDDDNSKRKKLREKLATYLGCENDPKVDDFIDKIKSCFFDTDDKKVKIETDSMQYNDSRVYEFILHDNNVGLINILNNLCKLKNETNFKDYLNDILKPKWEEKDFSVFAEFEYKHLCIYNTIMSLLETNLSFEYIKKEITHLSRLVCNIAEQYALFAKGRNVYKPVAERFAFINTENEDIYASFIEHNKEKKDTNIGIITQDEVKKCKYILSDVQLESKFREIEGLKYLKGAIGFLIDHDKDTFLCVFDCAKKIFDERNNVFKYNICNEDRLFKKCLLYLLSEQGNFEPFTLPLKDDFFRMELIKNFVIRENVLTLIQRIVDKEEEILPTYDNYIKVTTNASDLCQSSYRSSLASLLYGYRTKEDKKNFLIDEYYIETKTFAAIVPYDLYNNSYRANKRRSSQFTDPNICLIISELTKRQVIQNNCNTYSYNINDSKEAYVAYDRIVEDAYQNRIKIQIKIKETEYFLYLSEDNKKVKIEFQDNNQPACCIFCSNTSNTEIPERMNTIYNIIDELSKDDARLFENITKDIKAPWLIK